MCNAPLVFYDCCEVEGRICVDKETISVWLKICLRYRLLLDNQIWYGWVGSGDKRQNLFALISFFL